MKPFFLSFSFSLSSFLFCKTALKHEADHLGKLVYLIRGQLFHVPIDLSYLLHITTPVTRINNSLLSNESAYRHSGKHVKQYWGYPTRQIT